MSKHRQELHLTPTGDVLPLRRLHSSTGAAYSRAALCPCQWSFAAHPCACNMSRRPQILHKWAILTPNYAPAGLH